MRLPLAYLGEAEIVLANVHAEAHFLIDRGEACYVILYDGDAPVKVRFLGHSFD